jgi:hypothetical protein
MKGFEVVHNYRFEESRDKDDELGKYLDKAAALGLKVMVGFDRKEGYTQARTEERVRKFRQHPALWAWYLYDEPEPEILERARGVAGIIRSNDDAHPIIVASDTPEYIALADMSFAYCYPVLDQSFPKQDLNRYTRKTDSAAASGKPFISLVQTFNWNHYVAFAKKKEEYRLPSLAEMRFMAYSGILRGGRGVFFFSFQTLPIENDHLNHEIEPLIKELKMIRPFLAYKNTNPDAFVSGLPSHSARTWTEGNNTFLIVSNPSSSAIVCSLKTDGRKVMDLRENSRNVLPAVQLGPWDARIYLIEEGTDENITN